MLQKGPGQSDGMGMQHYPPNKAFPIQNNEPWAARQGPPIGDRPFVGITLHIFNFTAFIIMTVYVKQVKT